MITYSATLNKTLPRAMWLSILDSSDKKVKSELAPFVPSYEVGVLLLVIDPNITRPKGGRSLRIQGISCSSQRGYGQREDLTQVPRPIHRRKIRLGRPSRGERLCRDVETFGGEWI